MDFRYLTLFDEPIDYYEYVTQNRVEVFLGGVTNPRALVLKTYK